MAAKAWKLAIVLGGKLGLAAVTDRGAASVTEGVETGRRAVIPASETVAPLLHAVRAAQAVRVLVTQSSRIDAHGIASFQSSLCDRESSPARRRLVAFELAFDHLLRPGLYPAAVSVTNVGHRGVSSCSDGLPRHGQLDLRLQLAVGATAASHHADCVRPHSTADLRHRPPSTFLSLDGEEQVGGAVLAVPHEAHKTPTVRALGKLTTRSPQTKRD